MSYFHPSYQGILGLHAGWPHAPEAESSAINFHPRDLLTGSTVFGILKAENFSERVGSDAPGNGCKQPTLEAPRTLPKPAAASVVPPSRPKTNELSLKGDN